MADDSRKPIGEYSEDELLTRFRNDILYDAHGIRAKVRRSDAFKEIKRRLTLRPIATYLRQHAQELEADVIQAYKFLMLWFFEEGDPRNADLPSGAGVNDMTPQGLLPWIEWAERHASFTKPQPTAPT